MCAKQIITCGCENDENLGSGTNDSVVTCDRIMEQTKNETIIFNNKKSYMWKRLLLYFTCFLLATILLLIDINIYYYYWDIKQKQNEWIIEWNSNIKLNHLL